MTAALLLTTLIGPLVTAAIGPVAPAHQRGRLAALATLPAVVTALVAGAPTTVELPWLLLGTELTLAGHRRLLLVAVALVWLAGGMSASTMLAARRGSAAAWSLALTGNLAVVLAGDAVTLYLGFAVMTFAAVPLILHERTAATRRAARTYVALGVVGEALVLAGLLQSVGAAGDAGLTAVRAAMLDGTVPVTAVGLLFGGFAVKAGVLPVHAWLPLAHPAAPVPASAVLSGAMIKAGVIGWLALLPIGDGTAGTDAATDMAGTDMATTGLAAGVTTGGSSSIGAVAVALGLTTIVVGALLGSLRSEPKVILAYSSVSQMGFLAVIVGLGLLVDADALARLGPGAVVGVGAVYVLHHALAKAALFLAVGLRGRVAPGLLVAGCALAALALAGAPWTSGYIAKLGVKELGGLLADPWAELVTTALSIGAIGTTLVMARFLAVVSRGSVVAGGRAAHRPDGAHHTGPERAGVDGVVFAALIVGVVVATSTLPRRLSPGNDAAMNVPAMQGAGHVWVAPWSLGGSSDVIAALWPVLVGVTIAALVGVAARRGLPDRASRWNDRIPPGDVVALAESGWSWARDVGGAVDAWTARLRSRADETWERMGLALQIDRRLDTLDDVGTRWRTAGVGLTLVVAITAAALLA